MSARKRRERLNRRGREWDEARPCSNCGQPGKHYVPPSLGESGFFACVSVLGADTPRDTK